MGILSWAKICWDKIKATNKRGMEWIGTDGLINMETAAILTIFLMIFFPTMWAMLFSAFVVVGKSIFDKTKGHTKEGHDLICAVIGVLLGALLGFAQAAITIL